MHGGTLNLPEWQERYDAVCAELAKVDAVELEQAKRDTGMGSDEEDDDAAPDETATPKPKPRKSQLDVAALEAEVSHLDPALITKLRLTKKYYADALRFITQLESAVPTLCQLLVSTTKSEVLEAMRFFRTAYEYNLASADTGIKTMLHLIWTKDNNSTVAEGEVDGRSVKGNLIEVYRALYFDVVPDLAPKQQVSRIAKNMIE